MSTNSQKNKAIVEPENGNSGVGNSSATTPGEVIASPQELSMTVELQQRTIDLLTKQLEAERSKGSNSIQQLADLLANSIAKKEAVPAPNVDNLNRTSDFKNTKNTVDGRSLMEAQQTLQMFRSEKKKMISVPKSLAQFVGSALTVTVNGVRVSIPCDGKSYPINETHYEHARERMAKLDIIAADTEPQVVEIG
jgi:hypothetical protein